MKFPKGGADRTRVLPNEIHGFLRHASWVKADEATASFLARTLGVMPE